MKKMCLFQLISLLSGSYFLFGCMAKTNNHSFENVPLRYEISFQERNDIADNEPLLTNVTYHCLIELDIENNYKGEPVFTYDKNLAEVIVDNDTVHSMSCSFYLAIKDVEPTNLELNIEWRTQKITKTYSIAKNADLATCYYDYQYKGNQMGDYDDLSVVDDQEKYNTLKSALKNYVNGYKFPDVTFDDTFLLVGNFYVSGGSIFKYNQCFIYNKKLVIDYKEKYQSGSTNMVISGVHITLLEFPKELKESSFISHISPVSEIK